MPAKRRKFSPQFKAETVQMVVQTGRTVAEVAEAVPDRIERAFTAEAPGRAAVGDIT